MTTQQSHAVEARNGANLLPPASRDRLDSFEEVDASALFPPPLPPSRATLLDERIRELHGDPIAEIGTVSHPVRMRATPRVFGEPPRRRHKALVGLGVIFALTAPFALGLSQTDSTLQARAEGGRAVAGPATRVQSLKVAEAHDARPIAGVSGQEDTDTTLHALSAEAPAPVRVVGISPIFIAASEMKADDGDARAMPRRASKAALPAAAPAFDYTTAMNALANVPVSGACGGEAVGTARISVTFAPSGNATRALVLSSPLKGTDVGSCVARVLRDVRVPAHSSGFVTVTETVGLR